MTAPEHIDELAELYALGTLDATQQALVDGHVRTCELCAARLGEAEAAVAHFIDESEPSVILDRRVRRAFARRSPWRWAAPLVAAAFVIGLLPSIGLWSGVFGSKAYDADRQAAVQAMVNSHFAHAPFAPLSAGAPKAKLIYSPTGDWRFIVAQTNRAYEVAAQTGGQTIALGKLHVSGNAGELFLEHAPSARTFVLLDGTTPVDRVTLPRHR